MHRLYRFGDNIGVNSEDRQWGLGSMRIIGASKYERVVAEVDGNVVEF